MAKREFNYKEAILNTEESIGICVNTQQLFQVKTNKRGPSSGEN